MGKHVVGGSDTTKAELTFSGPDVWPRLTGEEMVDLWIFKRPELIYLKAMKLSRENKGTGRFTVIIQKFERKKGKWAPGKIKTKFVWEAPKEGASKFDVSRILERMRELVRKIMPREPDPEVAISLKIKEGPKVLAARQEVWL